MGLFSRFKKIASGEIYKQNTIVYENVNDLLEKDQKGDLSPLASAWVYSSAISIGALLNHLIFDPIPKEVERELVKAELKNPGERIFDHKNLNKKKGFRMFQILNGYILIRFLNSNVFKELIETDEEIVEFEEEILNLYQFSPEEKKNYFELKESYEEDTLDSIGDISRIDELGNHFMVNLNNQLLGEGVCKKMKKEEVILLTVFYSSIFIFKLYNEFMDLFNSKVNDEFMDL